MVDSTISLANMNHFLNGSTSSLSAINSIGESGIAYCILPPDEDVNAYRFATQGDLESWLESKSYKDDLMIDINGMNSEGNGPCPECESLKGRNKPNLLQVGLAAKAWKFSNGTGPSVSNIFPHKTLFSFNNEPSRVDIVGFLATGRATWCTEKKYKGSRLVHFKLLSYGSYKILQNTIFDKNFESVY